MPLGKDKKKAKQDKMAAASSWMESTGGGGGDFTVLDVPKGMNLWSPKEEKVYNVTVVPFEVTEAAKKFSGETRLKADVGQYQCQQSYMAHRGIGLEGSKKSYVCSAKTFGKKCYVCEYLNKLSSPDNDPDTVKLIKSMAAKTRQVWNVVVHEERAKGVQLWDISWFLFGDYLREKIRKADPDKKSKYEAFFDPNAGYDLRLAPTGKSFGGSNFLEFVDIEFKRRKEPIADAVLAKAVDLSAVIKMAKYDELKELMSGGEPDKAEDEDEEVDNTDVDDGDDEADDRGHTAPPAKKKGKTKTKPAPVEDDEDEPEEDDDGEDSEDEPEDEDDEDESEEDDDAEGDDDDADDEGDDDDDAEDDDDESPEIVLKKSDRVEFLRKGNKKTGIIRSIDKKAGTASLDVKFLDRPITMPLNLLTPARDEKAKKPTPPSLDDDDDAPLPTLKKPAGKKVKK